MRPGTISFKPLEPALFVVHANKFLGHDVFWDFCSDEVNTEDAVFVLWERRCSDTVVALFLRGLARKVMTPHDKHSGTSLLYAFVL